MPDPFTVIDRLQREWPVIAGAPLSFTIAVLITSALIGFLLRWHYRALLSQKDEQLKTKDEQLAAREQVINEYRERQKADLENKVKDLEQKPLQRTEKKEQTILTPDTQHQLVTTLKKYAEDPANVDISFAEIKQRPLADTLIAIFALAGWKTSLTNIPFDSYVPHRPYVRGIEVLGYNKMLVEAVTAALKTAGLSEAKATVGETQVKRENPKWNSIQHSIRIIIEHHE